MCACMQGRGEILLAVCPVDDMIWNAHKPGWRFWKLSMMRASKMKWVMRIFCVVQRPSKRSVQNSVSSPPVLLFTFSTIWQLPNRRKRRRMRRMRRRRRLPWSLETPKVVDQCLLFTLHLRLSFPPQRIWAHFLTDTKNPFWRNFEWFCITVLKESGWISREKKSIKWGSREVGLDRSRSGLEMGDGNTEDGAAWSAGQPLCFLHFCLCASSLLLFTVK